MDVTACTLLLVDDEEANLDLLELMLRQRGYRRLVRVSDARQAVAAFEAARPDLVLLDLHMPHRTGFEVLADLRARMPADEYLPVLVLTADATARAREQALAGGAHDFVLKPFDRTEVQLRVRNLLHTRLLHAAQREAREGAERAAARDRLLAESSRALAASFDSATALGQVARLLVPALADACTVSLATADGAREPVAAAGHLAPEGQSGAVELPLAAGGAPSGWLALHRRAARAPFDDADRALAAELAHRMALALEGARLYRDAQAATAAREQVLAVVAHDLRSPITAARFDLEMLRDEPEQPLGARDARTLDRVARAVGRVDALIEDLLDMARLGRGVLALDPRPLDLDALLRDAATELRPLVEGHGLRFVVRAPGRLVLPALDVDARRLLQALSNLVGNAAKFAAHEGQVELAWERAGGELRIAVRDDGPGIPPDQVQHVFGAFWQARHADRRGLGLGLAIARGIVEAHGGRLWVDSAPRGGSTFIVALPLPAASPRAAE